MNCSTNSEKLQIQYNQFNPTRLILTTYISLKRLNRSKYQLEQIIEDHLQGSIRKKASAFLQKNLKLASIAAELIDRLRNFPLIATSEIMEKKIEASLAELKMEIDILDDMHFKVAKSYTAFIHENYEATVISIANNSAE